MEEFRQAISRLSHFSENTSKCGIPADDSVYETLSTLSTNERLLSDLFQGIDFNHTGTIDYSEFLAACLARKEGMKREYAELIFDL